MAHGMSIEFGLVHSWVIERDFARTVIEDVYIDIARIPVKVVATARITIRIAREKRRGRSTQEFIQAVREHRAIFKRDDVIAFFATESKDRAIRGTFESRRACTFESRRDCVAIFWDCAAIRTAAEHNTSAVSVAPGIPGMDDKIFGQFRMRQAPKVFALNFFKIFRLLFGSQMLQAATTALAVQRAKRFYAIGACFQNIDNAALGKVLFLECEAHLAEFTRERTRHKAHATIFQTSHALAPLHHFFDAERQAFTARLTARVTTIIIAVRTRITSIKAVLFRAIVSAEFYHNCKNRIFTRLSREGDAQSSWA